ncbi:MAG: RNA pseudouridine synthase [Bacteroidia bacterium]|nr:RNA pseudouridine synthase [Bacteroidia bacterium]MBN8694504.1 RNA pseudouridine synthase [Bacteroidota bacterium]
MQNTIHKEQIVYEDNHILIINKLPGEIVQGDKTGDMPLSEKLKNYIKERDNKPGNVFMGVIHRLDRPVSGLVIFAKTSKGLSRFNEMIREKDLQKTYWAVVKNKPAKTEDHLIHYLLKNEKLNKSKAHEKPVKDGLKSELIYKYIKSSDTYHLLEIKLLTGRHHQIRAQLSAIGCPIKGDLKYGFDRTNKDGSIHLHAYQLQFMHPVKKEEVIVKAAPLMNDPVWNYFK